MNPALGTTVVVYDENNTRYSLPLNPRPEWLINPKRIVSIALFQQGDGKAFRASVNQNTHRNVAKLRVQFDTSLNLDPYSAQLIAAGWTRCDKYRRSHAA